MKLKRLYLHHFRNYEQTEVRFAPGVNFIYGDNAQGKTNLLEAIYLLSTGRSFRTTRLHELIMKGKSSFYLEAEFEKEGITQTATLSFDGKNRKAQINHTNYNHFSALLGLMPTVLYAPSDICLISGSPADRRRFLDLHIAQFDPFYVHHSTRYHKAMKQRNHLLRHEQYQTMEIWEKMMAASGAYITEKRRHIIEELRPLLKNHSSAISEKKDLLSLAYTSSIRGKEAKLSPEAHLLNELKNSREKDAHYGNTLVGPHRDDLFFSVNKQNAKLYASEGQKRCAIAALRLAQWDSLRSMSECDPIMSIDDFGVHLDPSRKTHLEEKMSDFNQVFLTSPEPPTTHLSLGSVHHIDQGALI